MKNFKSVSNVRMLTDGALFSQIQALAAEERKLTLQVLELLREVERRRLYAQQGYASLFEYVVKALGYSEASASRRINSMRLLKEVPEIKESIERGTLNLSKLSTVQTFLKREERERGKNYSTEEKRDLVLQMENASQRQCEKVLVTIAPESVQPKDRVRVISEEKIELRFVASEALMAKVEKLKGLLAHSNPNLGLAELFDILADRALSQLDPMVKREKVRAKVMQKATPTSELGSSARNSANAEKNCRSRFIPAGLRREIWWRDRGQCTYVAPDRRRCSSKFGLEIDHITPVACGGRAESDGLRLLCREHNQWEAIQIFGTDKMKQYLPGLK